MSGLSRLQSLLRQYETDLLGGSKDLDSRRYLNRAAESPTLAIGGGAKGWNPFPSATERAAQKEKERQKYMAATRATVGKPGLSSEWYKRQHPNQVLVPISKLAKNPGLVEPMRLTDDESAHPTLMRGGQ